MRAGSIAQFGLVGLMVGVLTPFIVSVCLFSSTLQTFLSPQPTAGFWSGASTPVPSAAPSPVQASTAAALRADGGAIFLLGSVMAALLGEFLALRGRIRDWAETRNAWLGAIAGSVLFLVLDLAIFLH